MNVNETHAKDDGFLLRNKVPKMEAIKFGWNVFKQNWKLFVPLLLILTVISYLPSGFRDLVTKQIGDPTTMGIVVFVTGVAFWVLQQLINIGTTKISLEFADGKKSQLSDLFNGTSYLLNYIGASILFGIIVLIGFILLIVPGIIFAIKLQFYPYLIIDKNMGPIEALKGSWEMTKGIKLELALFSFLTFLINLAGALALVVGLFVSVPMTMVAYAYVYRKLNSRATSVNMI